MATLMTLETEGALKRNIRKRNMNFSVAVPLSLFFQFSKYQSHAQLEDPCKAEQFL